MSNIDTKTASEVLRSKAIDLQRQSILITNFNNSEQEQDFTEPSNCGGFGRIRHFKMYAESDWPINPLPVLPAYKALKIMPEDGVNAQVFQNAVCNWRCWYCFVDFKLLSGNTKYSKLLTCNEMLDLYQAQEAPPLMIDLTGGQPDISPEWVPWMMEALIQRNLHEKVYLWSDDNLSNDYFWQYLSKDQINLIRSYRNYGRVCCFKGINEEAFIYNTGATGEHFLKQFDLFKRLLETGMDLYSYITLTTLANSNLASDVTQFFDRIQAIDENYPLRIVPLKIKEFTPVVKRVKELQKSLMEGQHEAIELWNAELKKRFSKEMLQLDITEIKTKYSQI